MSFSRCLPAAPPAKVTRSPSSSGEKSQSNNVRSFSARAKRNSRERKESAGVHKKFSSRRPTVSLISKMTSAMSLSTDHLAKLDSLPLATVTLIVGADSRLFAAHQNILIATPFFRRALLRQPFSPEAADQTAAASSATPPETNLYSSPPAIVSRQLSLPDEIPEIFSCVLEYMYKGDYSPRLIRNEETGSRALDKSAYALQSQSQESSQEQSQEHPQEYPQQQQPAPCVYRHAVYGEILKDAMVYCAALKYGIDGLRRTALRKLNLQFGLSCRTILASARYAYDNTPDTDSRLRNYFVALIIRSRTTFKRSGILQQEMLNGGSNLFFDLFVALSNQVDGVSEAASTRPRIKKEVEK